jgi:hypothetical protein
MTFLNNGRLCMTGHSDGTIRVWDANSLGKSRCPVQSFGGHHGKCVHVCASGDGCDVISGGDQGAMFIWKFLGAEDLSDILEDLVIAENDEAVRKGKKVPSSPGSPIPSWEVVMARGKAERAAQDEIDDAQVVQTVSQDHPPFRKCFVPTVEDSIPKHVYASFMSSYKLSSCFSFIHNLTSMQTLVSNRAVLCGGNNIFSLSLCIIQPYTS